MHSPYLHDPWMTRLLKTAQKPQHIFETERKEKVYREAKKKNTDLYWAFFTLVVDREWLTTTTR